MLEGLKSLFIWMSNNNEKGFIFTVPTFDKGIHLSIGFDKKRNEFNIHYTNDNIKETGKDRRKNLLVIPSFRFFLMLYRLEKIINIIIADLVFKNRCNLGKIKKHNFILMPLEHENIKQRDIFKITKNGRKWKTKQDLEPSSYLEYSKEVSSIEKLTESSYIAFKYKGSHLSVQGFILNFPEFQRIFFIPKKQFNKHNRRLIRIIYNYLNHYPTKENLAFRELLYNRLSNF